MSRKGRGLRTAVAVAAAGLISLAAFAQDPTAPPPTEPPPPAVEKPTQPAEKPAAPPDAPPSHEKPAEPTPAKGEAPGAEEFTLVVNTPVPRPTTPAKAAAAAIRPDLGAVREGLKAYFRGDYARAIEILTPITAMSPAARLFFAYSLTASQLVQANRKPEVFDQARREYQQAIADGAPKRNQWISPSILEILEKAPGAAAAPAAAP